MPVPYDALSLFGPLLVGAFLNAILYGACMVQCFTYYQTYKKDRKGLKLLVLYLMLMETFNTIINIGLVFEPLVLKFGNPQAFIVAPKMLILDAISTVFISTPVQFLAAWRIYVISESKVMPLIIGFFGFCSLIGGSTLSIQVSFFREWAGFKIFDRAVIVWLTGSAAADIIITVSLCWTLYRWKTGMKATDDRVSKIVRLTMQTGLLTTIFALLDLIISLTVHRVLLNFAWDLALSKLYTNSLLSTLNARGKWDDDDVVHSSHLGGGIPSRQHGTRHSTRLSTLAFRVTDVVGSRIDDDDLESGSVENEHSKYSKNLVS
ncbi:hypothetical protein GALMADRAFT_155508 [Galerina marginata CBS 339.88]|uniref:DUF6534 domain-containing protein n=1 Tax=Galerina marginata (strain CBS 339.88) TaxID=685588 RepID=A0A067T3K3_GALM3|nr:hypothetical protein GALMADRAFT_155508 [Galerina marginata CBS 339.88]